VIPGNTSSQGKYADQPSSVSATAGNAQATVSFTLPAYDGKGVATYVATSSPGGITGSGSSSPITVTGLTNGTAYTFTVTTVTGYGVSATSGSSNSVTPVVPGPPPPPPPPPCSCASQPWPNNCSFVGYTCDGQMRYDYYDCGCSQTCPGTGGYNGQYVNGYCGYSDPCAGYTCGSSPADCAKYSFTDVSSNSCNCPDCTACYMAYGDCNCNCPATVAIQLFCGACPS
jgi:hypothetical protein